MPGLTLLLTSPRVPAGLLCADAWSALRRADRVCCADPALPLAAAVSAAGVRVDPYPGSPRELLAELGEHELAVWLADPDQDPRTITRPLADLLVGGSTGGPGDQSLGAADVEVIVGSYDRPGARVLDLVDVMDRLRAECPWDREQTHDSLVRYLVEETYETIDAIETGDPDHLREELGDLLLQVLFHARVASEDAERPFDLDDVAAGIVEKLVRRHPHVFADTAVSGVSDVAANWEQIKQAEKRRTSVFDGLPPGLPALLLADKVLDRLERAGAQVPERPEDLGRVEMGPTQLGERLLALVAAARAAGLDPEAALRRTVRGLAEPG